MMGFVRNLFWKMLMGGKKKNDFGEIDGIRRGMIKTTLGVSSIENKKGAGEPYIALEVISKSILSYQITPFVMNREACMRLQILLQEACDRKGSN
jgi:hypothetical protein